MVHELLKGHLTIVVLQDKSVPQGPVAAQEVGSRSFDRIRKGDKWQGQISKPVLEEFNLGKIPAFSNSIQFTRF